MGLNSGRLNDTVRGNGVDTARGEALSRLGGTANPEAFPHSAPAHQLPAPTKTLHGNQTPANTETHRCRQAGTSPASFISTGFTVSF